MTLKGYFAALFDQQYIYEVDRPIEMVRSQILSLFTTKMELLEEPNINGTIINDQFKATPQWSMYRQRFRGGGAEIRGVIQKADSGTKITVSISPDYTFTLLYLALSLLSLGLIVSAVLNMGEQDLSGLGILLLIVAHTVVWFCAYQTKHSLRITFENALSIEP